MPVSFAQLRFMQPSPVARRLLWHVLSLGPVTRDEPERHAGMDKAGAFLFWIHAGEGELSVGRQRLRLAPGPRCWLLDLARDRTYTPVPGTALTTQGIRFRGPGLEAWLERLGAPAEFAFRHPAQFHRLRREYRRLLRLVNRRPRGFEWEVHLRLNDLLGVLLKAGDLLAASPPEVPVPVQRVLDAVQADPARSWKAAALPAVAGVSYSTFRVLFQQSQGETLCAFLQRVRLDQACGLLSDARLSVKDVARRLNFSSEFYFSHFFHRATGFSPSQFRRRANA
jgi:AraC-like DNA-binding protein